MQHADAMPYTQKPSVAFGCGTLRKTYVDKALQSNQRRLEVGAYAKAEYDLEQYDSGPRRMCAYVVG